VKTTGVIRRIDELGRIVIPKEIRKNLRIRDGENIEILTDENSIILKKYSRIANYLDVVEKIGDLTSSIMNYSVIATDREKVVFVSGIENKDLLGKLVSKDLISLIDQREILNNELETKMFFEKIELCGYFAITPIISSNDSLGLIIIYNKNKLSNAEIQFSKLFAKLVAEKIDISW